MVAQAAQRGASGKTSLLSRLHAWWEGYEADDDESSTDSSETASANYAAVDEAEENATGWTPMRLEATQRLFGEGQVLAYSAEFIEDLLRPLGLNESHTILEYHCRIGTNARALSRSGGAWIDAMEIDPLLAEYAQELSTKEGLQKKVVVHNATLAECPVKAKSRDAVIAFEALYADPDKTETFSALAKLMKPGAQLLLTDICWRSDTENEVEGTPWAVGEAGGLQFARASEYREILINLGFDVHVTEDISERYCTDILLALQRLKEKLQEDPVPAAAKPWVLREVETWASRAAVLQHGSLGLFRIHARSMASEEL